MFEHGHSSVYNRLGGLGPEDFDGMPQRVSEPGELRAGDLFEDCRYHPCLCIEAAGDDDPSGVWGISLVDGSPCGCCIWNCGLRKLTVDEAVHWKYHGPPDIELPPESRWWAPEAPAA